jgi:hypothetical protein
MASFSGCPQRETFFGGMVKQQQARGREQMTYKEDGLL